MLEQKGGKLTEAVTADIIDSSKSVLQSYRGRGTRGLQQFFSPPQAAQLVHSVFGDNLAVLDLTAGNGALISQFPQELRYGIEIDPEYTKDASYNAITGDIQKVYPLLRRVGFQIEAVAINPPFGLTWEDDGYGGQINSTVLTYLYSLNLMSYFAQGAMICGHDRLYTKILPKSEGRHVYAIVEVDDMFDGVDIKTAMVFYTKAVTYSGYKPLELSASRAELPGLDSIIRNERYQVQPPTARVTMRYTLDLINEIFGSIEAEYTRRYSVKKQSKHSVTIDRTIRVSLNPYQKVLLSREGHLSSLENLHGQSVNYLALNPKTWTMLEELESEALITIAPSSKEKAEDVLREMAKEICPLYPVKPQQRLGFLSDTEEIKCIKDDESQYMVAGQSFPLSVRTVITREEYIDTKVDEEGNLNEITKAKQHKMLEISIGDRQFSETKEDIEFIIEHFDIPDPLDIATKYPEEFKQFRKLTNEIEGQYGFQLKEFQHEDIARLLFKGSGLLSWEQGLGKTLGGLVFTEACIKLGAEDKALFIVPQDIIPQWKAEVKKWFGDEKELIVIRNISDALKAQKHLENGGTGWYISYYEAISRNGRTFELLPHGEFRVPNPNAGKEYYDWTVEKTKVQPLFMELNSKEFCPQCQADVTLSEWRPKTGWCGKCGYSHIKLKVKPAYRYLTTAFKNGIIIIDEGTKIKGQNSLMSKSVRGLKAKHKLLLTGTPIKNYIPDAFWLLWWSLGNNSERFPFDYDNGPRKFTEEFSVIEYQVDKWGRKIGNSKVLPEVSNLSILWRLLCSSIIRRRKEDTGEPIVDRLFKTVTCPFGVKQKEMYEQWLDGFADYFIATHPDSKISEYPDLVQRSAAILGQLWKLEFAAVLPEAEPTGWFPQGSNWTPANLKVLELAEQHAQAGDKVLIGSDLMGYGKWIAEQLEGRSGVRAVHIVSENKKTGKIQTKAPAKRASITNDFRQNGTNVLCASLLAMNLGHNLDVANIVIVKGLSWDFATFDQFIARVHRLTSKRDVIVYIVLTEGSIDERKWKLLNQKGAATQLALDGELYEQREERIDLQAILEELIRQGVVVDETVPEHLIQKQWLYGAREQRSMGADEQVGRWADEQVGRWAGEQVGRWADEQVGRWAGEQGSRRNSPAHPLTSSPAPHTEKKLRKLKIKHSQLTLFEM